MLGRIIALTQSGSCDGDSHTVIRVQNDYRDESESTRDLTPINAHNVPTIQKAKRWENHVSPMVKWKRSQDFQTWEPASPKFAVGWPCLRCFDYVSCVTPIQIISSYYAGFFGDTYADNLVIFPTRPLWTDPIITPSTQSVDIPPKSVTQEDQALYFRMRKHQRQPKHVLDPKGKRARMSRNWWKRSKIRKSQLIHESLAIWPGLSVEPYK